MTTLPCAASGAEAAASHERFVCDGSKGGADWPGRLVLVVGPSGAGKNTIIAGAKAALCGDASMVLPRRIIARRATEAEDDESLDETAFEQVRDQGAFTFWWQAHGLHYR